MPEIAGGNVGSVPSDGGTSVDWIVEASTCAPQSPSPPFPPSPSDGVLSGHVPVAASGSDATVATSSSNVMSAASSNSSGTTVEDLLSESSYSSAPSPCSSRSYNRADFPNDSEIEEFMSPSFQWPLFSSASFVSRQDSSRLTNVVPPFPPSPSNGGLSSTSSSDAMSAASSNFSGTTVEDLLSESSYSSAVEDLLSESAPSPCSSRSYNRADFPFDNEIEEFISPSFEWPPSSSASLMSRQDRLTDVVQRQSSRRQLLRKVRVLAVRPRALLSVIVAIMWGDPVHMAAKMVEFIFEENAGGSVGNQTDVPSDDGTSLDWIVDTSFVSRQDRLTDVVQRQSSRRQLLREVHENFDRLLALLRLMNQLSWSAIDPYERARRRIEQETYNVLAKTSALVTSKNNIIRRVFTISKSSIEKVLLEQEKAIGNISWLIRVAGDKGYLGLPPIANDEPVLYFVWEQVTKLIKGSPEDQAAAAAELGSLDGKLVIEEGGVQPLLNLLKAGKDVEVQERAAKALGLLGREGPWGVDVMLQAGICTAFTKVLYEGDMKVQAMVAWAVSELAAHHPQCQDDFAENNVVQLLVGHLAFETFQEQRKSSAVPVPKAASIHSVVLTDANAHIRGGEQDPATKSRMKAMAARALSALAKGNSVICKSIIETRALLTLAVLLEKGTEEVQSNSAIAVMEIARVAEADNQIRSMAFQPSSPAAKAVVNQLLQIVRKAEYNDLLVPSIVALGCLSKTFRATETRLTGPLVRLLDDREADVMLETAIALTKFAETDNYLCKEHCKSIIDEGGVKHLVQLVYFGELVVQKPALILLCYVAKHMPDSDQLAELLSVFQWAAKQSSLIEDDTIKGLLTGF